MANSGVFPCCLTLHCVIDKSNPQIKLPEKIWLFSPIPGQDISKTVLKKTIYVIKQIFIYPLVYFVAQIVDHEKKKKNNRTKPQNKTKIKSEREKDNSLFIMHAELSVH